MSLFDNRDFKTKSTYGFLFEGKKEEPELEPEAELEDEDAADKDAEKIEEGAIYECVGCPAIVDAKEDNEFFTLEAMAIVTALGSKEEACTEAYAAATSYNQKVAVTESFKESAKKYWERFKGFLGRVRNMIVRTIQRFMGYIKRLIARLQAKWVTRDGSVEDIKRAWKENKEDLKDVEVEVHEVIMNLPIDGFTFDKAGFDEENKLLTSDALKARINQASSGKDELEKMEDELENEEPLSVSDMLDEEIGDTVTISVLKCPDPDTIIKELKNVNKVYRRIEVSRKAVYKKIDFVENQVKKVINKKSSVISYFVKYVNKVVQNFNRKLSALNQITVIWVRERIKVLNAIKSVA